MAIQQTTTAATVAGGPARWQWAGATPIVWRDRQTLQVGLGVDGLLVHGADPASARMLRALRHPTSASDLVAECDDPDRARRLLDHLHDHGLLRRVSSALLRIIGDDPAAAQIASALAGAGHRVRRVTAPWAPGESAAGDRGAGTSDRERLTVAVFRAPEAERALLQTLREFGEPHLVVRTSAAAVAVGPLVLPGRTPCIQCEDLAQCVVDPGWPAALAQLCHPAESADPSDVQWAVATAVQQVQAFAEGSEPETLGAVLQLGLRHVMMVRRLRPHPACSCRSDR